jgi:hypothetical protein
LNRFQNLLPARGTPELSNLAHHRDRITGDFVGDIGGRILAAFLVMELSKRLTIEEYA